jgi:ABC-2 type transport system permease protein
MDVPAGRLAGISLASVLVVLPFGALALAVGCATGRRGGAAGFAATAAVAAFLLETLGSIVPSLDGWRVLSPWNWYASDEVLRSGLALGDVALLVGVAAALAAVAIVAVERRDLGV